MRLHWWQSNACKRKKYSDEGLPINTAEFIFQLPFPITDIHLETHMIQSSLCGSCAFCYYVLGTYFKPTKQM